MATFCRHVSMSSRLGYSSNGTGLDSSLALAPPMCSSSTSAAVLVLPGRMWVTRRFRALQHRIWQLGLCCRNRTWQT